MYMYIYDIVFDIFYYLIFLGIIIRWGFLESYIIINFYIEKDRNKVFLLDLIL